WFVNCRMESWSAPHRGSAHPAWSDASSAPGHARLDECDSRYYLAFVMPSALGSRPPPGPESRPPKQPPETGGPARPSWRGWIVLALLLLTFYSWNRYAAEDEAHPAISYTAFYQAVQEDHVDSVTLKGQHVTGRFDKPVTIEGRTLETFRTMVPVQEDTELLPLLREKGVTINVRSEEQPLGVQIILSLLPFALIIGAWVWLSRRAQSMMGTGE